VILTATHWHNSTWSVYRCHISQIKWHTSWEWGSCTLEDRINRLSRTSEMNYHSTLRNIPEDPIYTAAEAQNHPRLHNFGDKLLETSYLLPRIPGIPVSIFFQRVAAYTLTEVICDFPLSLKPDHTHLNLSFTTSLPTLCHVHIRESVV